MKNVKRTRSAAFPAELDSKRPDPVIDRLCASPELLTDIRDGNAAVDRVQKKFIFLHKPLSTKPGTICTGQLDFQSLASPDDSVSGLSDFPRNLRTGKPVRRQPS